MRKYDVVSDRFPVKDAQARCQIALTRIQHARIMNTYRPMDTSEVVEMRQAAELIERAADIVEKLAERQAHG